MYKLKDEKDLTEVLLALADGICEAKEQQTENSGLYWLDKFLREFFKLY